MRTQQCNPVILAIPAGPAAARAEKEAEDLGYLVALTVSWIYHGVIPSWVSPSRNGTLDGVRFGADIAGVRGSVNDFLIIAAHVACLEEFALWLVCGTES